VGVGSAYFDGTTVEEFLWTPADGKTVAEVGASEITNLGVTAESGAVFFEPGGDPFFIPHPTLGDLSGVSILDISDANVAVGYAPLSERTIAFVWDEENGSRALEDLGVPAITRRANAINEDAVLVGTTSVVGEPFDEKAFVLDVPAEDFTSLHLLLNPGGGGRTRALDISDTGYVAGDGSYGDGAGIAGFRWSAAGGFDLLPGLAGGLEMDVFPEGVNDAGVVVGRARDGEGEWRAFVWSDADGMRDLEALSVLPDGFNLQGAESINDIGWIRATGFYGAAFGPERAVVFVPSETVDVPGSGGVRPPVSLRVPAVGERGAAVDVAFELQEGSPTRVTVHDVQGRQLATLVDAWHAAGSHRVRWDASGNAGAGVYFVRLHAGGVTTVRRTVRLP